MTILFHILSGKSYFVKTITDWSTSITNKAISVAYCNLPINSEKMEYSGIFNTYKIRDDLYKLGYNYYLFYNLEGPLYEMLCSKDLEIKNLATNILINEIKL